MSVTPERGTNGLDELAVDTIRTLAIDGVEKANSGHPGAPMGLAPLGYVLFTRILRHNPADPNWPDRDRFLLSNGHASMLQYALLHLSGYDLPLSELEAFRQWDSLCPGHPEFGHTIGIEATTGPLGQGISTGIGMALAEHWLASRYNRDGHDVVDHYIYAVVGDGDMQEGISSEAASFAGELGLSKLIAIYDHNGIQIEGSTSLAFRESVPDRFRAYDWHVIELEAEATLDEIELALREAKNVDDKPSLVVLPTHIGYGSPNKQDSAAAHGAPLGEAEVKLTKEALGWKWDEPFYIPPDVTGLFKSVGSRGIELQNAWSQKFEAYADAYPAEAAELQRIQSGAPSPALEAEPAPQIPASEPAIATRSASGKALNWLLPLVPELIGGSADLAPSTNTTLKGEDSILHRHFSGRNLHFGVREHAMGAVVNGLTLSKLRAYGATFLVFSDYMRGAIRLAALMNIPSAFVFTHDSIGLGEDGPTHQPIEHLASLRAMPNLTVIRPADFNETQLAWRYAALQTGGPVLFSLTRQKLPVIDPAAIPADAIERGGYVLSENNQADVTLIATGSEVQLATASAADLSQQGVQARVVSLPSWERFAAQDAAYQASVIKPDGPPRVSIEMASTFGWERYTGSDGLNIGIDHFGASAPIADLLKHFGFTPDAVSARVKEFLNR